MAVESVLKAWVFLVYHFEKQGLSGRAERQDASCFAVLESWARQGALDRGMGNGEEEREAPMLETGGRDILSAGQTEGRKTF